MYGWVAGRSLELLPPGRCCPPPAAGSERCGAVLHTVPKGLGERGGCSGGRAGGSRTHWTPLQPHTYGRSLRLGCMRLAAALWPPCPAPSPQAHPIAPHTRTYTCSNPRHPPPVSLPSQVSRPERLDEVVATKTLADRVSNILHRIEKVCVGARACMCRGWVGKRHVLMGERAPRPGHKCCLITTTSATTPPSCAEVAAAAAAAASVAMTALSSNCAG